MAAINSNQTGGGPWSAGSSWVGGVAPGENDQAYIWNGDTITIDSDIVCGGDSTDGVWINQGGILEWLSTVAGNYTLTVKGNLNVPTGATLRIGTVANPIPANRTATIKLNYSAALADGKYGLILSSTGTFICQGASDRISTDRALLGSNSGGTCSTSGTTVTRKEGTGFTGKSGTITINGVNYTISSITNDNTLVLTGSAGSQTNASYVFQSDNTALTTASSLTWRDNDVLVVAPTDRTYTHYEKVVVNGDATATTTVNIDGAGGTNGGLLYGHMGTSPIQAEVINLTRNIVITAYDASNVSYVSIGAFATVDIDWTEFSYLSANATGKHGVDIQTTTGSCHMDYCSIHDTDFEAIFVNTASGGDIELRYLVIFNTGLAAPNDLTAFRFNQGTSSTAWVIDHCIVIHSTWTAGSSGTCYYIQDYGGTFTNNVAISSKTYGFSIWENTSTNIPGNLSGNVAHSCGGSGFLFSVGYAQGATLSNFSAWRNASNGFQWTQSSGNGWWGGTYDGFVGFGNANNIGISGGASGLTFTNAVLGSDNVFTTTANIAQNQFRTATVDVTFIDCDMSVEQGIIRAATYDVSLNAVISPVQWRFYNCDFGASGYEVYAQANMWGNSFISSDRHGKVAGKYKRWVRYGTIENDPPQVWAVSTMNNLGKLEMPVAQVCVNSGETATVTVEAYAYYVSGDDMRLIVKANPAVGLYADTVIDTDTTRNDWVTLSGTTPAVTADGVLDVVVDFKASGYGYTRNATVS